jgi:hypothetical protein
MYFFSALTANRQCNQYCIQYLSLHDSLEVFVGAFDERSVAQLDYRSSLEVAEVVRLRNRHAFILPVILLSGWVRVPTFERPCNFVCIDRYSYVAVLESVVRYKLSPTFSIYYKHNSREEYPISSNNS